MNAVVDTNVVAYFLLGTEPFALETRRFWETIDEPVAPAHWQAELVNVIWMAVKTGALAAPDGYRRIDFASRLRVRSVALGTLWQSALALSIESGVSAYDTLFIVLAQQLELPLVTFDKKLLKTFPYIARRPDAVARK
jgi:predicted nucleic acid-binding protein